MSIGKHDVAQALALADAARATMVAALQMQIGAAEARGTTIMYRNDFRARGPEVDASAAAVSDGLLAAAQAVTDATLAFVGWANSWCALLAAASAEAPAGPTDTQA